MVPEEVAEQIAKASATGMPYHAAQNRGEKPRAGYCCVSAHQSFWLKETHFGRAITEGKVA